MAMGRSFEGLTSRILGAAVDVHLALGPGVLESNYARALRIALSNRGVPYHAEREIELVYAGEPIGSYRLDLIVGDTVVVELKAVTRFEDAHFAQLHAYLRATGLQVGLLLNFNAPVLAVRRVMNGADT